MRFVYYFLLMLLSILNQNYLQDKAKFKEEEKIIDLEAQKNSLFVLKDKKLEIFKIENIDMPELISRNDFAFKGTKIFLIKNYISIIDSENILHLFKIDDFEIEEINNLSLPVAPIFIFTKDDLILFISLNNLLVFRFEKDLKFKFLSKLEWEQNAVSAKVKENYLFVSLNSNKILCIDFEDPEFPYILNENNTKFQIIDFAFSDSYIYCFFEEGYYIFSLKKDNFLNLLYQESNIKGIKDGEVIGSYLISCLEKEISIYKINNDYNLALLFKNTFEENIKIFKTEGSNLFLILKENILKIFNVDKYCENPPEKFMVYEPIQKRDPEGAINLTFDFSDSNSASTYDIYLDFKNPPESKVLEDLQISKGEIIIEEEEGKYYFKVIAKNGCGEISSEIRELYISPPGSFELLYPEDGAENLPTEILFDWTDSQGANYYELYLGKTIPPPLYASNIPESQIYVTKLEANTKYYWYVKAINNEGSSTTRKRAFKTASPELHYGESQVYDYCYFGGFGFGNKIIEPGERINFYAGIYNTGMVEAKNTEGFLYAQTGGVQIINNYVHFPDVPAGGEIVYSFEPFIFDLASNLECMSSIKFDLVLFSNGNSWTEHLTFEVGKRNYKLIKENFSNWTPENWFVINNGGNCLWESTETTSLPNYTGGEGPAAVADSDWCGEGTQMDTELWTPLFNLPYASTSTICLPYGSPPLPYATAATLEFKASYRDSGTEQDNFKVEISTDGGNFWETLLFWNEDHSPLGPGELVKIDLTPFAGLTNLFIRFIYKALDWLWWAEVDDVEINVPYACTRCGPPPQNFNLIYPQNGQTGVPLSLTLQWEPSENASCYNLYLGNTNPPPLYSSFITQNQININLFLSYTWYYWQVEAVNEFGLKKSEIYSFRTKSLNGPMEVPDGALKAEKEGDMIKLSWGQSCGTSDNYTIYEGNLNLLSSGVYNHYSIVCSDTNNDLQESFYPNQENAYYLVVPRTQEGLEGSYGKNIPQGIDMANCGITDFQPEECPTLVPGNYIYYGYHQQTNNGDWEGFINSPADFKIENGYLTEIDPFDYGIVYITPANYVIMLSNNFVLNEPLLLVYGNFYEVNYHLDYTNSSGNVVLTADYQYSFYYFGNYIYGSMTVHVVALDPAYNPYQGRYYFNFEVGIIGEGNGSRKFLGFNMQTNNGDWEGFINSPLNVTIDNLNVIAWDEDDMGIVYITEANYVIMLGYGQFFSPPIQIENGQPFNISYTIEYFDSTGKKVLTADWVNNGVLNFNYLTGSLVGTIKALDPKYKDYAGKYYWNYEGGIQETDLLKFKKDKEKFKILGQGLKPLKLELKEKKLEIKK